MSRSSTRTARTSPAPARRQLAGRPRAGRAAAAARPAGVLPRGSTRARTSPTSYEAAWLPRGFGVVHSESPGTGHSDGCPTSGGPNETLGATAVIDWLNGRRRRFTTRTGTVLARARGLAQREDGDDRRVLQRHAPDRRRGHRRRRPRRDRPGLGDLGLVRYYRANGLVRAPHSDEGGTGNNTFQGEDLDVLADAVYSRRDEGNPRTICRPVIDALKAQVARDSGDRTAVWRERTYDLTKIKAATLIAHGGDDFNVMTEQAAQLYATLNAQGTPHAFYFHQDGHGGDAARLPAQPVVHEVPVEPGQRRREPASVVGRARVRRSARRAPRRSPPRRSNTAELTVASTAPFRVGLTLTVARPTHRTIRSPRG